MSAPNEAWISAAGHLRWLGQSLDRDDYSRYLSADLTCGECQRPWALRVECPNGHIMPTSKHAIAEKQNQLNSYPACMAFVPKVQP